MTRSWSAVMTMAIALFGIHGDAHAVSCHFENVTNTFNGYRLRRHRGGLPVAEVGEYRRQ